MTRFAWTEGGNCNIFRPMLSTLRTLSLFLVVAVPLAGAAPAARAAADKAPASAAGGGDKGTAEAKAATVELMRSVFPKEAYDATLDTLYQSEEQAYEQILGDAGK